MAATSITKIAAVALSLASANLVMAAEPFPVKPIRIIVASAAGGSLDITTRMVAKRMGEKLGQPIVVENRAGAGSLIAIRTVKTAQSDGYTLLAAVNTVTIQQAVAADAGYDLTKDFIGVGPLTRAPFFLVTAANQPDKSAADLIARARQNPGTISYASAGNGSTTHIGAAIYAQRANINLQHVPYKGNAASWTDLMAGRVGVLLEAYGSSVSMIRDGRLKALGVTSSKRVSVLPEVPTLAEQGVPNFNFYFWIGLMAPAGTPKDIADKLNDALSASLADQELKDRFREEGAEVMSMGSDDFTKFLKDEASSMSKLVNDLNLPKQ